MTHEVWVVVQDDMMGEPHVVSAWASHSAALNEAVVCEGRVVRGTVELERA
jgi:hypothetical protein